MRTMYESEQDRINQRKAVSLLCSKWDCSLIETPPAYPFDYMLMRHDKAVAFLEVKVRNKDYGNLMLSLHKWTDGRFLSDMTKLPFMLAWVVKSHGRVEIRCIDVGKAEAVRIGYGGRQDRSDGYDLEPVVFIDREMFTHSYDVTEGWNA